MPARLRVAVAIAGSGKSGFLAGLAAIAEHHVNCPFAGAAHDVQLDAAGAPRRERVEQVVEVPYRPAAAAIRSPCARPARAAGLPAATSRTSRPSVSGRPTARRSRLATWRGDFDAKPQRCRGLAAGERIDPAVQRLVGGYGQVEALAEAVGVDAEQLSPGS